MLKFFVACCHRRPLTIADEPASWRAAAQALVPTSGPLSQCVPKQLDRKRTTLILHTSKALSGLGDTNGTACLSGGASLPATHPGNRNLYCLQSFVCGVTAPQNRPLTQHPTLACQPDLPASAWPGFPAQERSCLGLLARVQLYSSSRAIIQLCIAFAATLAPARALMAAACLIARICTICAACEAQRSDYLQACALV